MKKRLLTFETVDDEIVEINRIYRNRRMTGGEVQIENNRTLLNH
jgi:hypothetical protein